MHKTKNDLSEKVRIQIAGLLQERLADAIDLVTHAKQAHWNVKGSNFIALHELFDKVYENAAGRDHVEALSRSLAYFASVVRQGIDRADEIGDHGAADIFTEISRGVDKDLWFLEAHLQEER